MKSSCVGLLGGLVLLVLTACRGGVAEDPILALAAREALDQGKAWMEQEKYARARPYLLHAFEVEPNSVVGREGLLLAADTYYLQGGRTNLIQAEAKYKDFLNRFPTSDKAPYVQFQIGNSLARRIERPDRDQSNTMEGLQAYLELLRLYPTSEYAAQARDQIKVVRDNLAEHEFQVGYFYLRRGLPIATVQRLEFLLENYPDYAQKDKALFYLGQAYDLQKKFEDSAATYRRLVNQYPGSEYIKELPDFESRAEAAAELAAEELAAEEDPS